MARFECNVISYVLQRTVDITVVIPSVTIPESLAGPDKRPSHVITDPYPVVYLLHGMGNDHATWCSYSNIEMFAEERRIAVVMISGENKFYRTVPGGDDHYRFIAEEVPEFTTNMFPISPLPEHAYIAGLSMDGAGALIHGIGDADRYRAIGAFSAAIHEDKNEWGIPDSNEWGLPDPRKAVTQTLGEGKTIPPIYSAGSLSPASAMNGDFGMSRWKHSWIGSRGAMPTRALINEKYKDHLKGPKI